MGGGLAGREGVVRAERRLFFCGRSVAGRGGGAGCACGEARRGGSWCWGEGEIRTGGRRRKRGSQERERREISRTTRDGLPRRDLGAEATAEVGVS